jgi:hypothetical protein
MTPTRMNKLRLFEIIVLIAYFLISIYIAVICQNEIPIKGIQVFWIFIGLFLSTMAIHSTSLGTSLRKLSFSLIWGLISLFLFLFPLFHDREFVDLFGHKSFPFMLPLFGFIIHHTLRLGFMRFFKFEPMTLWLRGSGADYNKDLNRKPNAYDKWFTFISFIGFSIMLIFFMTRK